MIDLKVCAAFGMTNDRLRAIFTAQPTDAFDKIKEGETAEERSERLKKKRQNEMDCALRERWRRYIQTRNEEGIVRSLQNWKKYAACDLTWDTSVITRMTMPLQMYAQGKIDVERACSLLREVQGGERFIKEKSDKTLEVDVPRFFETNINIVKSVITRRWAAQKNKFNELWPFYKYEARSTGLVAKCRADVLSQRTDIMADQYGYRNHDMQCLRDAMLYAHCVDFVRTGWEIEEQYQESNPLADPPDPRDVKAVVTKQGVGWFNPHPSRVYWDNARPLQSLNHDDLAFIGFWDICRYSQIENDPNYFNRDHIGYTGKFWGPGGPYATFTNYFTYYNYTVTPPYVGEVNPANENDRTSFIGTYSGTKADATVFITNYYEKVNPKAMGIADYPFDVWVRLVCASDSTVIYAEVLPSSPGAVLSINESDNRQVNTSMAMDLMAYQDQLTNLTTHLMLLCQIEVFKVFGINKDLFASDDIEVIKKKLGAKNWYADPLVVVYSMSALQEMKIVADVSKAITIAEAHQGQSISQIFEAIIKLISIVEKLFALSPAEQGQPAPREISATEVNAIESTTSSIYSSISDDVDQFRAAKKRIIYESLVNCQKGDIVCPVKDRYTEKTIKAAGFSVKQGENEDFRDDAKRYTIIGSPKFLNHDYIFTTRDGSERPVNTQAANTLVQLLGQILSSPMIAQACGKEKIFEIFNEIFRQSGAGLDLNLQLKEGESNDFGPDDMAQMKQMVQGLAQGTNQLAQQMQRVVQEVQDLENFKKDQETHIKATNIMAKQVQNNTKDIAKIEGMHGDIQKRLVESIQYDKAPPSVQAQIEQQAGLVPAPAAERLAMIEAQKKTPANGVPKK